jgi:diguanylate cyclase (GGDEF)-like protein
MPNQVRHPFNYWLRLAPTQRLIPTVLFWIFAGLLPLLLVIVLMLVGPTGSHFSNADLLFLISALLWLVLCIAVVARLLKPISYMAELLQSGNDTKTHLPRFSLTHKHETGMMFNNLVDLMLREQNLKERLARTDPEEQLTGFYSHRWGRERLEEDLNRAHRQQETVSLVLISLHNYNDIKLRSGRTIAERCIQTIAQLSHNATRKGDWLARWHPNQVLLVLWRDQTHSRRIAERIQKTLDSFSMVDEDNHNLPLDLRLVVSTYNGKDTATVAVAKLEQCLAQHAGGKERIRECSKDVLLSRPENAQA